MARSLKKGPFVDEKLLKKIISDIEESRNLSIEELEKRLGIC